MLTTIHLIIVICTGLLVLYSDEQAFMWVLGKRERLDPKRIHFLHVAVSTGLAVLILTGGLLYMRAPAAYLSNSTFVVKMAAIAALILNTYVISRLQHIALTRTFASLSHPEKIPLMVSGGVSLAGWITAIVCGLILG